MSSETKTQNLPRSGQKTITLKMNAQGKILISPENFARITVALPPELRDKGLYVVFYQNPTTTAVGLSETQPNVQITPISELSHVRQVNKMVAEIHKTNITPARESGIQEPYSNLREISSESMPHQTLKAELIDGKQQIDKVKSIMERLQNDGSELYNYIIRTVDRYYKSIEDQLIDLNKGIRRELPYYLFENQVPKWLVSRIKDIHPTGGILKPISFLYPKQKIYLSGRELKHFGDPFYRRSRVIFSFTLPTMKETAKSSKTNIDEMNFIIIPPLDPKQIMANGISQAGIPLSEPVSRYYYQPAGKFFGRYENDPKGYAKSVGIDFTESENFTLNEFIKRVKQHVDEPSPFVHEIEQKEWYQSMNINVAEEFKFEEIQLEDPGPYQLRVFRQSTTPFVPDQYWLGDRRGGTNNATAQLALRKQHPEAMKAFATLHKSDKFAHLAVPLANKLSQIDNNFIRAACYERVMASIMSAKLQNLDYIPVVEDEVPALINEVELPNFDAFVDATYDV